jgi:hypothetical protein
VSAAGGGKCPSTFFSPMTGGCRSPRWRCR